MKKTLLATVAAAALIAGPAIAQKQEAPAGDAKGAAPPPAAIQKAPAEKMAPGGNSAPDKAASDTKAPAKSTTGQAAPSGRSSSDTKTPAKSDTTGQAAPSGEIKAGTDTKSGTKASGTTDTKTSGSTAQGQAGGSVALTTEQKAKVRASVLTGNAPRVTNVNFSIRVGTVVPRTVRLVTVPSTLVEIHPAWRGFLYFVHGDEIIIIEPGTLRIVTIITV
jgi:hypothetical protein